MAQEFTVLESVWTGVSALLMHNGRLADPLDSYAKELKKLNRPRNKTEEQYEKIERVEYEGSLYFDPEIGIYQPTDNIWACIIHGARKARLGKQAESSILVEGIKGNGDEASVKLNYKGPNTVQELFANKDFVSRVGIRVQKSRIMRCRPKIPAGWKLRFHVNYDPSVIQEEDVIRAMQDAGALVGLGDWRPRFGRFTVEVVK